MTTAITSAPGMSDQEFVELAHSVGVKTRAGAGAIAFGRAVEVRVRETAVLPGHAAFALQALVAAGHVTQQKVDEALSIARNVAPAA